MSNRKEKGTVLVIVMLWLSIIVLLVLSGLQSARQQLLSIRRHVSLVQAQMLAELGLSAAHAQLLQKTAISLPVGANVQWSVESIGDNLDASKIYCITVVARYHQARARIREKVQLISPLCVPNKPCQPPVLMRLWWKEPKRYE